MLGKPGDACVPTASILSVGTGKSRGNVPFSSLDPASVARRPADGFTRTSVSSLTSPALRILRFRSDMRRTVVRIEFQVSGTSYGGPTIVAVYQRLDEAERLGRCCGCVDKLEKGGCDIG